MLQIIILILVIVAILYFNIIADRSNVVEGFDVLKTIGLRRVVNRHKRNCRKLLRKLDNDYVMPCKRYLKRKKLM